MFISVVICTRNRAQSLCQTLESMFVSNNLNEPDWEVVVVYNGFDTGESGVVCQRFQARFPRHVRFIVEKRVGKSHALNTGLAESTGDLIAMTDDDVRCGMNYISGIRKVFCDERVHGALGRVLLDCEGGRPTWMNEEMACFMSSRDFGDDVLEWSDNLTGANMVVRRDVVRRVGGFSSAMGAGASGFMEDSEFSMRVRRAGFRLIYAPQILVWHKALFGSS